MPETKQQAPRYYWWHGRDLKDFLCEIQQRGAENVRVEFHPADGMLYVKPEPQQPAQEQPEAEPARAPVRPFNFVHTCPPDCD